MGFLTAVHGCMLRTFSGSYQCYLARQPDFLQAAIKHAADNGYALGLKLVRGGYIVKEEANWVNKEGPAPVWPE